MSTLEIFFLLPDEIVVVGVATEVGSAEGEPIVGARVHHPAEADVQGAQAKLSVAEQVQDGRLLLVLGGLLLGNHSGNHVVHLPLVKDHLVPFGHLGDLLLRLSVLTLEISWLQKLHGKIKQKGTLEICHLTDSGTTHQ